MEEFIQLQNEYKEIKQSSYPTTTPTLRFADHQDFTKESTAISSEQFENNIETRIEYNAELREDPLLSTPVQSFLRENRISPTHNQIYYVLNNSTDPVLTQKQLQKGYRLSYIGNPTKPTVDILYNVSDTYLIENKLIPSYMQSSYNKTKKYSFSTVGDNHLRPGALHSFRT